jgi:hypothetical protein
MDQGKRGNMMRKIELLLYASVSGFCQDCSCWFPS